MRRSRAFAAVTAVLSALLAGPALAPARPAAAAPACQNAKQPGEVVPETPWAQRVLAPERAWPFSTGAGVTVAVIDSGSDANHPQLAGAVKSGFDFLRNTAGGTTDCVSHGTAVASIIAARQVPGVGFRGIAPDAKILPIAVSDREVNDTGQATGEAVDPNRFAESIRYAADQGARVINLSVVLREDFPAVRDAVAYAVSRNAVVVAAAGNAHQDQSPGPDPISYPAAYPDVLGVGAVGEDGIRLPTSQIGRYVDLVAPGAEVLAATRVRGHAVWNGTSFAAPFVSATAALVISAAPRLTGAQVRQRLLATASPAPGGPGSTAYGAGMVDPYRAVTERLTTVPPAEAAPLPARVLDPAAVERAEQWRRIRKIAIVIGAVMAGGAALLLVGSVIVPRARRRRWAPGRAAPLAKPRAVADDEHADPDAAAEALFTVPPAGTPR
jgi:type VII secretion-associated serine protease mycosin